MNCTCNGPTAEVGGRLEHLDTPGACRALVDSWMLLMDDVRDPITLSIIRLRSYEMLARARMLEAAQEAR